MKTSITAIAVAASVVGAAALAHGGATGVVKERMDAMKAMGDAVKAVAPMMRGEAAYDAAAVRHAAGTIAMHSGDALTELFPEGSSGAPSEARDEIWSDWDAFVALADRLEVHAEGLELAAQSGLASGQSGMSPGNMMGGGGMMGGGSMMGGSGAAMGVMTAEHIGAMPVDAAFAMTSQVCSACHTRFRAEDR